MKYRMLGRTGFEVSDIAHGLWGMSGWSGSNDQESLAAMQLAVDLGCNFFDTAWAYGEGKSDGLLGEIMTRNPKKRLYAASKIPPANERWPALPEYKYGDVFPARHVFQYADPVSYTHLDVYKRQTSGVAQLSAPDNAILDVTIESGASECDVLQS